MITNFSSNSTLKYAGNLGGGATVPANSYAIGTYVLEGYISSAGVQVTAPVTLNVYFGAGQGLSLIHI